MTALRLNIVTPERSFLDVDCISVTMPGMLGQMQILSGHAAMLAELVSGIVSYENSDHVTTKFMIGEGVVEIDHDHVNILCEQARLKSEIEKSQEENLLAQLKEQIKKLEQGDAEEKRILTELSRCVARLSLFE